MDSYGLGLAILFVAIFETAFVMWIYGVGRFSGDLVRKGGGTKCFYKQVTPKKPHLFTGVYARRRKDQLVLEDFLVDLADPFGKKFYFLKFFLAINTSNLP